MFIKIPVKYYSELPSLEPTHPVCSSRYSSVCLLYSDVDGKGDTYEGYSYLNPSL